MNNMKTKQEAHFKIFIISDSVDEVAQTIITSVLAQFPNVTDIDIQKFSFVDSEEMLLSILRDALKEKALVVTSLVNEKMNKVCQKFAQKTGLMMLDYMSPFVEIMAAHMQVEPTQESGLVRHLDQQYFDRVEAIEFAVRYDDGKDARGFSKADIVILGISRTSKTPVSMYLANKSYKVANLPLIPEVPIPKEIADIPAKKIIGLTADEEYMTNIRHSRLHSLGLNEDSSYVEQQRIREELAYAHELYQSLGAKVVNVKNKSIEEISQEIEDLLK